MSIFRQQWRGKEAAPPTPVMLLGVKIPLASGFIPPAAPQVPFFPDTHRLGARCLLGSG